MNADAVVFSFNRILDPKFGTQRTSYLEAIQRAVKVDDNTVDIITSGPSATLPIQVTAIPIVPPSAAAKLGTNPVGTGPYVFSKWDRGREIVAKKNEKYWGAKKPQIAEYHVRIIPDSQTALAALQTGEVDLVLDLLPEQKKLVPKFASVGAGEFSYIAFNTYKKELSDPRVRRALNFAVDKKALAATVYEGEGKPNDAQHLTKEMLGYNPDVKPFPYDVDEAKRLLAAAGYASGFSLDLYVPIGRYMKGEETSDFVAAQLAKVGVKVNVIRMDFNKFREVSRIKGTAAGAMDLKYSWNSNEFFDGSRIIAHITCDGTSSKICNPQIDKLMDEATRTANQNDRGLKYRLVWKLLSDDPYSIYLLQQNLLYGMTKRLAWEPRLDDEYFVNDMITTK
jgi:peptide/nickel transport system substrate-binding protein